MTKGIKVALLGIVAMLSLIACGKTNLSKDELKKDFFYIEDQYIDGISKGGNSVSTEKMLKHSKESQENVNKKIEELKNNQSNPETTKAIIKYGESTVDALKEYSRAMDGKNYNRDTQKEHAKINYDVSHKYFDDEVSKKFTDFMDD